MNFPKINLTNPFGDKEKSSTKTILGKFFIYFIIIFIVLGTILSYNILFSKEPLNAENSGEKISIWTQLKHLVASNDKTLKGEKNGRINILVLGIGGGTHDGSQLTDTNIIVSIDTKENKVAMLSIPRDLYVPLARYNTWRKINTANAYGEINENGQGPLVAKETIENIFDIPIHYYIRADFTGFEKIVDNLGNIDIYVENTFDDYEYPIRGMENAEPYESRFEHLHIDEGWQKMDGELALKYVRSRHAVGVEGSDFARAKRQQNLILAIKNKALSFTTFLNPKKITSLYDALQDNIATNLEIWEIIKLINVAKNINTDKIIHHVLDDSPDNLLYATITPDGAFILKPKTDNWSELSYLAQNIFTANATNLAVKSIKITSPIKIEIQNGTKKNGLAYKTSLRLDKYGYQTIKIGNAQKQNYNKTIIYDLTEGREPEILKNLKEELNANIALTIPGWLTTSLSNPSKSLLNTKTTQVYKNKINSQADFLIILGANTIPMIFNNNIFEKAITNNTTGRPTLPTTN